MKHPTIDIYFFTPSPASRAALLLIRALDIQHNIKVTNVAAGEQFTPEFVRMNPLHTIPVIDDNGFILYDSHVIMMYLVDQYGKDDCLYPRDPKKAAIVNSRLFFDAAHLYPRFLAFFVPTIFEAQPPDEENKKKLEESLNHLNNFIEKDQWVAGSNMTIADFSAITVISTIDACGPIDLQKYQNLWQWYQSAQNAMASFGYEEIMQAGAKVYGEIYKNSLNKL